LAKTQQYSSDKFIIVSISGEAKARISALACSDTPSGHDRWTLRLLADKAIEFGFVDSISHNAEQIVLRTPSIQTNQLLSF
jgi:hypothetical protein